MAESQVEPRSTGLALASIVRLSSCVELRLEGAEGGRQSWRGTENEPGDQCDRRAVPDEISDGVAPLTGRCAHPSAPVPCASRPSVPRLSRSFVSA